MALSILLPDFRGGGAERVCLNLANEFVARGRDIDLLLMRRQGELLRQLDSRVPVGDLPAARVPNALFPLSAYLRQRKPEALFAHMWPLPVIALWARTLARSRTRIVGVTHTTWSQSELFADAVTRTHLKLSMRVFYPHLDGVVAVSNGAAADLSRISGLPRDRITTIYNPIVGASFPSDTKVPLPKPWAEGVHDKILAVGTLKPIKDYPTLLRAFARLRDTRDARLVIRGEVEERQMFESRIASLGLGEVVLRPGFATATRPYFEAADLFVLSSTGEGFGNVIVEALEQGTPVVSTDCPSGPGEVLEQGRYGTLVSVGDVDALAAAMQHSLSRDHDRESLKRRAHDFTVDKAADAYLRVLSGGA